jgi:succinoglycan biosynthesis transport protein ExoP
MTAMSADDGSGQDLDIRAYLDVVRRRYWQAILPALVVLAGAIALAYLLPKAYRSTATILVESQQIPTEMANPTVSANVSERLQIIKQRLLARENLLSIASKYNLFASSVGGPSSPSEIVEDMRSAILIEQIDLGRQNSRRDVQVIGFTVSFDYKDPTTASRVANELVSSILTQNIETRMSRAAETTKFFAAELKRLESLLLNQEARIADFKRKNEALLPETLSIRREQQALIAVKIEEIERQVRFGGMGSGPLSVGGNPAEIEQLGFQLEAKTVNLESMQEQREQMRTLDTKGLVPKNRVRELDRQIETLKIEVEALNARIVSMGGATDGGAKASLVEQLQSERLVLEERLAALTAGIEQTPVIEAQLNELTRLYDGMREEFVQAQAKLADATIGERLEQDRQSERFEVVEQAAIPQDPVSPDRPKILLGGLFGSLASGVGVVILLELLNQSIRTSRDMERRLQLRPIAVIPYIRTPYEARRRRMVYLIVIAGVMAAVVLAVGAIHFFYMPLDLIYERILDKLPF